MAAGTLYTYPDNFRAAKALISAQYANANVKVAPNFTFGESNKSPEFIKKFPGGRIPAFESSDGKILQDSNAIAYYVANDQLRGTNEYDRAQILQWIGFAENEVLPAGCAWVFPILGIVRSNPETQYAFQRAKDDMKQSLVILNSHLLTRTFLVGERITLADIVVACNLLNPYKFVMDPEYRKPLVNVNRWFNTLLNQPEFKAVLGEVELCSKVAQCQIVGEAKSKKKEEKKQEKKQQPPKKETPKKEKEPVEEMDAAEAVLAAEPKSKDPFDAMPKGTFNMDDFKRFYSNEDEAKSIPYFWEKFDPENYSIWFCEYKYPDELAKVFMSCNLITGMYQRLDKMRKQAFASVCLFGEDNNSTISGIWVWRGQELAFPLYMAVVVPIDLPGREAYLGWFFEAIHSTPSNQTSYEYPPLLERQIDRKLVYNSLENKIEVSGYPGKACLLRAICEMAMHSVDMTNGVLGDLLHIIFMPSTTMNFNLSPEYTDAERCGRKHECTVYHKNCTTSFLDMISFIDDTL